MPEMGRTAKAFCTSAPYQAVARRWLLPRALQGVEPEGEVLEIGTGSGAMAAQLLSAYPRDSVVATDYDTDMVATAMGNLARYGERARVERADATALPFEDGRFDLVLTFTMLHHVLKWEDAIREAVRVLKPGGRLVGHDLVDSAAVRMTHRREHSQVRLMRRDQLTALLGQLPLSDVRLDRALFGAVVKFRATRS